MKKFAILILSLLMAAVLMACAGNSEPGSSDTEYNASEAASVPDSSVLESEPENNVTAGLPESSMPETGSESSTTESEAENSTAESEAESSIEESGTESSTAESEAEVTRVLVAYFSATNTTEGVAERIANGLNADLYEIVPQEPYTDADLNYNDNSSRSTLEMNDPSSRPAISGSVEDMAQYDIIFIGYPIWWGEAPRIISTFMESYDFSGKTIVPFCTSGGSGISSSVSSLKQLAGEADWLDGRRLNGSDSQDTVMEWVNSLDLDLGE